MRVFRLIPFLLPVVVSAADLWLRPSVSGGVTNHSWSCTANWLTGSDTYVNRVPVGSDAVTANSILTTPANPLLVDGAAVCSNFQIANLAMDDNRVVGVRVTSSGSLTAPSGLTVGGAGNGVLTIEDGGGVTSPVVRVARDEGGTGAIRLRGGTLAISANTTGNNVFIQKDEWSTGTLRGWGRTLDTAMNDNNVRFVMNGQVVADAEGDPSRLLDLGRAVVSSATVANGRDGTSGWYAVNKGKLIYPRRWITFGAGDTKDWVIGENGTASSLDLVNTLGGTIRATDGSWSGGGVVKAALFATDRTDYPSGLPVTKGQVLLGVWAIWAQRSHSDNTRKAFTSTSVRIRYDRRKLGGGGRVALFRHMNGNWTRLVEGPQAADATVCVENQGCLSGDQINIGWYAVVGQYETGTNIVLRGAPTPFTVDANLPAGNIRVKSLSDDRVLLENEMRDTDGWWFYWAFRARGGAGRRMKFSIANGSAVGTRGPAVSTDRGATWSYAASGFNANSFTYRFAKDAREVWFSMGIPYTQRHWEAFLARQAARTNRFETSTLCLSKKGRPVEKIRLGRRDGEARYRFFLTCRHHCCEMTASYVLEGVLEAMLGDDELGQWYRANAEVTAVPFVDKDGVEDGDQGKNRKPWDHCRDYNDDKDPIHPEVAAIKALLPEESLPDVVVDFHCPYISGGRYNERIYQVGLAPLRFAAAQVRLGEILESVQTGGCAYAQANDLAFGLDWNTDANYTKGSTFIQWTARHHTAAALATSFEIPFANVDSITLDEAKFRAFGRDVAVAFREFLVTRGE